jgi:hypothetical protein
MTPRHPFSRRRQARAGRVLMRRVLGGHDIWAKVARDPRHVVPRNAGGEGCGPPGAARRRRGAWARLHWAQELRAEREIKRMAEVRHARELRGEAAQEFLDDLIAMGFE